MLMSFATLFVAGAMIASPTPDQGGLTVQWDDALSALAARQSASHRLSIVGTHVSGIVDAAGAEELLLLTAGESVSPSTLIDAIVARSATREAWTFDMRQERFVMLRESRLRLVELDTTVEGLSPVTPNAPANVLLDVPVAEELELTPEGRRVLTNGLLLVSSASNLVPRSPEGWDFSTKDWPLLVSLAGPSNVPLTQEGDLVSIVPTSADGLFRGVHEFDASRVWRPTRSQTVRVDDGAVLTESRLGYASDSAAWPSLIVTRCTSADANEVVCVVACEWAVGDAAAAPVALRVPPVHLSAAVDGAQPACGFVEPAAWTEAGAGSRLPLALALILNHWGSAHPDADFTGDGVVDSSDVEWTMLVMNPPASE